MKVAATLSLLAGAAVTMAQDVQSKPFNLVLKTQNKDLDGKFVSSCHSGAAIESLCIADKGVTMHLNTTEGATPPIDGFKSATGLLTWTLPGNLPFSESMLLSQDPASNVAQALFFPSTDSTYVAFDAKDRLTITSYIDDTTDPITATKPKAYYRWYVCDQYYSSYRYKTLSWVYGSGKPQNPTCVKVDVKRQSE